MTMVAVVNSSSALKNIDAAFLVEGCRLQLLDFYARWTNLNPYAVELFSTTVGLPVTDVYRFEFVDKLDVEGALAYHSVDADGRPYAKILAPADPLDATSLSHEIPETAADETCDRWVKMPDGTELAVEVVDPVQGDSYTVQATVLGETRPIKVSSFVLPSFFDPNGVGPYDWLGNVRAPFGMSAGGYEAVIDPSGLEHDVFARLAGASAAAAPKLHDGGSRLARRLRAVRSAKAAA